jgi:hypothetical protein
MESYSAYRCAGNLCDWAVVRLQLHEVACEGVAVQSHAPRFCRRKKHLLIPAKSQLRYLGPVSGKSL